MGQEQKQAVSSGAMLAAEEVCSRINMLASMQLGYDDLIGSDSYDEIARIIDKETAAQGDLLGTALRVLSEICRYACKCELDDGSVIVDGVPWESIEHARAILAKRDAVQAAEEDVLGQALDVLEQIILHGQRRRTHDLDTAEAFVIDDLSVIDDARAILAKGKGGAA